ncbi:unnamed protein product [Meganyctiphanes norvegica]|uniref:Uncharacterized protein n=1 Tax=Meganyctiphanes norvegica TaxID=48144 RepID=A0AAV2PST0_MEGNR
MKTLCVFALFVGVACAAPWGGAQPWGGHRVIDSLEDLYGYGSHEDLYGYGSHEDLYGYGSREIVVPYSGFRPVVNSLAGANAPTHIIYEQNDPNSIEFGWAWGKGK